MSLVRLPKLSLVPAVERHAALAAVIVSVVLSTLKFVAYYITGSSAVFSDALESVVNVAASGFAIYALALSHEPADDSHPYGHGKVEFLSATFEGGMIFAAGVVVLWRAVQEILAGPIVGSIGIGAAIMGVSAVVNLVAGLALVRIGKRRSSLALEADGHHLLSDVVTSGAVLVALALIHLTGKVWIDVVAAILVAFYLFFTAARLIRQSTAGLMDEQDLADDELLRHILDRHINGESAPQICSYHKLRHRHNGRMHWVDFHILMRPDTTVSDAHQAASAIEHELEAALGDADATAHIEPCPGCRECAKKNAQRIIDAPTEGH